LILHCEFFFPAGRDSGGAGSADLRHSEVQYFRAATGSDEDVRRFDVAMDDSLGMRCLEPIENLDGDIEQAIHLQRGRQDEVFQGDAVEELHCYKQTALSLADVIQRADVGMVQSRRCLRLALKAVA
jgi:hypothetical protein